MRITKNTPWFLVFESQKALREISGLLVFSRLGYYLILFFLDIFLEIIYGIVLPLIRNGILSRWEK